MSPFSAYGTQPSTQSLANKENKNLNNDSWWVTKLSFCFSWSLCPPSCHPCSLSQQHFHVHLNIRQTFFPNSYSEKWVVALYLHIVKNVLYGNFRDIEYCEWRLSYIQVLLTYLLTPWCRVLLERLTGLQLVKKFPAFHGTRMFITALTSVRHLSLSCASPIQSIHPHPTSWRSVLILSTHPRLGLSSGLLPSGFSTKALYPPYFTNTFVK